MSEPIAFVDLAAQQVRLRAEIDRRIAAVLDHGQYVMGPEVAELEERLAELAGAAHVVSCASGTDALLMPLMAMGVGPGDAVIVPSFTFASTAEVVALVGATPVFAEVRPDTFDLDPNGLASAVEAAERAGLRAVAVVPVDLFGLPADYTAIERGAAELGLWVLADGAQSLGGGVGEARVGSFGRVTGTSFFPAKPLGCYGDGGAVFTDDDELAGLLRSIRVHGKGADKYDNVRIGINGRLDTIQAAILLAKLDVFEDELDDRQLAAERYGAACADLDGVQPPVVPDGHRSAWAQYTLTLDAGIDRDAIAAAMRADGVPTMVYYPKPLHQQTAYRAFPVAGDQLPVSDALARTVLSVPMHPYLTEGVQDLVASALRSALSKEA